MGASVSFLEKEEQDNYMLLGIFPDDTQIPFHSLKCLWMKDDYDIEMFLGTLIERNLIQSSTGLKELGKSSFTIHDLLVDYIHRHNAKLTEVHTMFLDNLKAKYFKWKNLPNDGYLLDHFSFHLNKANQKAELRKLL